jgi:hypothetical protein
MEGHFGRQAAPAAAGGRSLDLSTQLGELDPDCEQDSGWRFTAWPECAEASLVWLTPPSGLRMPRAWKREARERRPAAEPVSASPGALRMTRRGDVYLDERWTMYDPAMANVALDAVRETVAAEQAALRWKQANGRAATKSRRYFVRNKLRYMWVLTFSAGQFERRHVMREVSEFARRLRSFLGGAAIAYWYSPELHPGGHGWHVNFFIAERVEHRLLEQVWGSGFVWVTDFAKSPRGPRGEPLGLCRSPREGWRRAAHYGCKYAQKDWSPEHIGPGNHRYEVAQGFAPTKVSQWVADLAEAEQLVASLVPSDGWGHMSVWDSNDSEDWTRPPVRTWRW